MAYEYAKAEYYDARENQPFKEALLDKLVAPAYIRALDINEDEGGDSVLVDEEFFFEGVRSRYDFFAEKGGDAVVVNSCLFTAMDALTDEALELLHDEIGVSDLPQEAKQRYLASAEEIQVAVVETFVKRNFEIRLRDGGVKVRTEMGFSIDGREIDTTASVPEPHSELDFARETVFEQDEIVELVRGLYCMELITQDDVKDFLNSF